MRRNALIVAVTVVAASIAVAAVSSAAASPQTLTLACALKGNGLLKYVASASGCPSKQGTLVQLGVSSPVSLCRQPDGSVRLIPPRDCTKASGTMFTIPSNTPAYFCVNLSSGGALRYVSDPSLCKSTETVFVVGNHAPTDIALSNTSVAENQSVATIVGTFSATDPDAGDSHTFTLVSGDGSADNAAFSISGNTLTTAASFDYETKDSYSIRVQAKDALGLTYVETFTITVTDVADGPVAENDAATVAEDSADNAIDVLANDTDVDGGTKSVQSVTDPAHGSTTITGGGTGVSYTPDAGYCNTAAGAPDTFMYTLNGGSSATVSITVTCANELPCLNDGWKDHVTSTGQPFSDEAACLSYVRNGGTLYNANEAPCLDGGYANWVRSSGQSFSDQDACVNYVRGNGILLNPSDLQLCQQALADAGFTTPDNANYVLGTDGNDTLLPTAGTDMICGFAGDDTVQGDLNAGDIFLGAAGGDYVVALRGGTFIGGDGGDTVDKMRGGTFDGGAGNDRTMDSDGLGMTGGTFNGGDGSDFVEYLNGGTFNGGADGDSVRTQFGGTFNGGDGNDSVSDLGWGANFNGDGGDDRVSTISRSATFQGGPGCDSVSYISTGYSGRIDLGDQSTCSG